MNMNDHNETGQSCQGGLTWMLVRQMLLCLPLSDFIQFESRPCQACSVRLCYKGWCKKEANTCPLHIEYQLSMWNFRYTVWQEIIYFTWLLLYVPQRSENNASLVPLCFPIGGVCLCAGTEEKKAAASDSLKRMGRCYYLGPDLRGRLKENENE